MSGLRFGCLCLPDTLGDRRGTPR